MKFRENPELVVGGIYKCKVKSSNPCAFAGIIKIIKFNHKEVWGMVYKEHSAWRTGSILCFERYKFRFYRLHEVCR